MNAASASLGMHIIHAIPYIIGTGVMIGFILGMGTMAFIMSKGDK